MPFRSHGALPPKKIAHLSHEQWKIPKMFIFFSKQLLLILSIFFKTYLPHHLGWFSLHLQLYEYKFVWCWKWLFFWLHRFYLLWRAKMQKIVKFQQNHRISQHNIDNFARRILDVMWQTIVRKSNFYCHETLNFSQNYKKHSKFHMNQLKWKQFNFIHSLL